MQKQRLMYVSTKITLPLLRYAVLASILIEGIFRCCAVVFERFWAAAESFHGEYHSKKFKDVVRPSIIYSDAYTGNAETSQVLLALVQR